MGETAPGITGLDLPDVDHWAGQDGMGRHTKASFRGPAFEGDVTYFDAEVTGTDPESAWGCRSSQVRLRLTNQDGGVLADCTAEVELQL